MNWVAHDIRDEIVDFVRRWSEACELPSRRLLGWIEISERKFRDWRDRFGKVLERGWQVPRDHWLEPWEKRAIAEFAVAHPLEGYRRLCFMMLDRDVVAVSPASVYRVLKAEGLLGARWQKPTRKGTGFVQPLQPHDHWHIDFSYLKIAGTFYHLCCVLDGCSRYIVAWDIRETMTEADAEIVLQRAREAHPQARPQIISDNGPQFVAKDFKEFIRVWQTTHVLTSPYYPQSNGKLERFHRTLKSSAIRPKTPLDLADARRVAGEFIEHYNQERLHSAIGYITPADRLAGRQAAIWAERDRKLAEARETRRRKRAGETKIDLATGKTAVADPSSIVSPEDRATQGCDPSAAGDSNTAGLGGGNAAQAGHLRDRSQSDKSQGAWGTESPKGTPPDSTINRDGEVA